MDLDKLERQLEELSPTKSVLINGKDALAGFTVKENNDNSLTIQWIRGGGEEGVTTFTAANQEQLDAVMDKLRFLVKPEPEHNPMLVRILVLIAQRFSVILNH